MAKKKSAFFQESVATAAKPSRATSVKAPAAKAKKGGADMVQDTDPNSERATPSSDQRERLKQEFADIVSRLSEQVDKAETSLNRAKETLKQERQTFNKLSQKLRTETKLLADLTAGRPVPRDLYSDLE